jgi:hypothetical protein
MTRRARRGFRLVAIAEALLLAAAWRSAGAYPRDTTDLSRLEFAPSLTTGTVPAGRSNRPQAAATQAAPAVDSAEVDRAITEQLDRIHAEESRNGPFSRELPDQLLTLSVLYQQRGQHDVALTLLDRARQIVRFNKGLYSLEQVPMVERALASRDALHESGGIARTEDQLLELARRNPSDARAGEIYYEIANRHVENVERYLSDGSQQFTVTMSVDGPPRHQYPEEIALSVLDGARDTYAQAIRSVARNPDLDGPSLDEVEAGLVRSYYLEALNVDRLSPFAAQTDSRLGKSRYQLGIREALHERGVSSYLRRMRYSVQASRPESEIAAEQLELGDWDLLFDQTELAFAVYRNARVLLERNGATPEQLEAFFSPTAPTLLPTFEPGLVDGEQAANYKGYVDVAIALDGTGKSTRVDVTGKSPGATEEIVHRLKKYVVHSRFRPRFENGEWASEDHVSLRYYFTY